jgi:hypothetical protein
VEADLAAVLSGAHPGPIVRTDRVVINSFRMVDRDIALAARGHTKVQERDAGA